jgi:uncharacterized protein YjbJ (UPF0337 family)
MQYEGQLIIIKEDNMINEDIIKGRWKEIKGEIKTLWGKLTDDELDKATGNLESIAGIIQSRYGTKKEEIQAKLEGIVSKFSERTENVKKSMKDSSAHP